MIVPSWNVSPAIPVVPAWSLLRHVVEQWLSIPLWYVCQLKFTPLRGYQGKLICLRRGSNLQTFQMVKEPTISAAEMEKFSPGLLWRWMISIRRRGLITQTHQNWMSIFFYTKGLQRIYHARRRFLLEQIPFRIRLSVGRGNDGLNCWYSNRKGQNTSQHHTQKSCMEKHLTPPGDLRL